MGFTDEGKLNGINVTVYGNWLSVSVVHRQKTVVRCLSMLLWCFFAQVGFTDEGKLNGINVTVYADCGCSANDSSTSVVFFHLDNGKAA